MMLGWVVVFIHSFLFFSAFFRMLVCEQIALHPYSPTHSAHAAALGPACVLLAPAPGGNTTHSLPTIV